MKIHHLTFCGLLVFSCLNTVYAEPRIDVVYLDVDSKIEAAVKSDMQASELVAAVVCCSHDVSNI